MALVGQEVPGCHPPMPVVVRALVQWSSLPSVATSHCVELLLVPCVLLVFYLDHSSGGMLIAPCTTQRVAEPHLRCLLLHLLQQLRFGVLALRHNLFHIFRIVLKQILLLCRLAPKRRFLFRLSFAGCNVPDRPLNFNWWKMTTSKQKPRHC